MKKYFLFCFAIVLFFVACPNNAKPVSTFVRPEPTIDSVLIAKASKEATEGRLYIFGENLGYLTSEELEAISVEYGTLGKCQIVTQKNKKIVQATYYYPLERGSSETVTALSQDFLLPFHDFIITVGDSVSIVGIENVPVDGVIVIPDGVEEISKGVFENNENVVEVDMENSDITNIGIEAFRGCKNLTTITFPPTLTHININCFTNCSSLIELDFSNTQLIIIKGDGFEGCNNLKKVIFPSSLRCICNGAFFGCTSLEEVYFADKKDWYHCPTTESNIGYDENGLPYSKDPSQCTDITEEELSPTNAASNLRSFSAWASKYVIKRVTTE